MRQVKLAGTGTLRAPLEQKLPIGAELHHPGVLVAVAHVKRAVACDGNSSRAIEMTGIGPRHAALTEGQQQSSVRRELIDLLKCHVSQPDVVMVVDGQTVRHGEQISAPASEQNSAMAIEDVHRRPRYRSQVKHIGFWPGATTPRNN